MNTRFHKQFTRIPKYFFRPPQFDVNKDYYKTLNVTASSSPSQIKQSFYTLAKKYHPDVSSGKDDKFKEINEAYEVLSDQTKKKEYDEIRKGASQQRSNPQKPYQQYYQQYSSQSSQQQQPPPNREQSYQQYYRQTFYSQDPRQQQRQTQEELFKAQMAAEFMKDFMEQMHRRQNVRQTGSPNMNFQGQDQRLREEVEKFKNRVRADFERQQEREAQSSRYRSQQQSQQQNFEEEMRKKEQKVMETISNVVTTTKTVIDKAKRLKEGVQSLWQEFNNQKK